MGLVELVHRVGLLRPRLGGIELFLVRRGSNSPSTISSRIDSLGDCQIFIDRLVEGKAGRQTPGGPCLTVGLAAPDAPPQWGPERGPVSRMLLALLPAAALAGTFTLDMPPMEVRQGEVPAAAERAPERRWCARSSASRLALQSTEGRTHVVVKPKWRVAQYVL